MRTMRRQMAAMALGITTLAMVAAAQTNTFPATGNVGIGTTAPQTQLQVGGGTMGPLDSNIAVIIGSGAAGSGIQLNSYNDSGKQGTIENWNGLLSLSAGTNGAGGSDGIQFNTANTTRMSVINNGNVGIGTTTPGATYANTKLEVNGYIQTDAGIYFPPLQQNLWVDSGSGSRPRV